MNYDIKRRSPIRDDEIIFAALKSMCTSTFLDILMFLYGIDNAEQVRNILGHSTEKTIGKKIRSTIWRESSVQ